MLGNNPMYRTMLAIDIEKSSRRGDPALLAIRRFLDTAMREALAQAGVACEECHRDDLGDGLRLVIARDVPKYRLIHPVMTELADRLRVHNRSAGALGTVRVRAALHAGDVHMDDGRVVGGSLEWLARLIEADPLRAALTAAPETATVALAVSEHIYEEVVRHGYLGIDPSTYQFCEFQVKATRGVAWVHIPGHSNQDADAVANNVAMVNDAGQLRASRRASKPPRSVTADNVNIVKGHARVGEQIGSIGTRIDHVSGAIQIGVLAPSRDVLRHQLGEIRRQLTEEQAAGRLDRGTYEAATDEIRAADVHLSSSEGIDANRLLLALKRLKGLIEDVAGVAVKVAAVIAATRSL